MKSFILIYFNILLYRVSGEEVVVSVSKGKIMGEKINLEGEESYYRFRGIPYAKPPVNDLRFKAPVELEAWDVMMAVEDGNLCPQWDISQGDTIGDEDCLNLNVYSPGLDEKRRAVLVYIHGGAFIMGGGSSYFAGPEYLIRQDVVLVTFNYRLGPFGFLSSGDKEASGNQGLLDQVMVLKWVKENIEMFGGNPNRITLAGEDSGAASITLLAAAPPAQGLFHGGILLSGNALCHQYFQSDPIKTSKRLAKKLDCSSGSSEDFLTCLKKQTQQDIIKAAQSMFKFWSFPRWFAPSVDGYLITDTPDVLFRKGNFLKIPFIVGQTKDEGAFFYRLTLNYFNNGLYDDNFLDDKLPKLLPVMSEFSSKLYPLTRLVKRNYFANIDLESEDEFMPRYIEFLTDLLHTRCTHRFAQTLANMSVPVYEYSFEYRGQYSIVNLQGEQVDMGVAHGDELQYLFKGVWGAGIEMSNSDKNFIHNIFSPLLTNFAKTSVPTPAPSEHIPIAWPPQAPSRHTVMRIDSKPTISNNHLQERVRFWSEAVPNLYSKSEKKKRVEL